MAMLHMTICVQQLSHISGRRDCKGWRSALQDIHLLTAELGANYRLQARSARAGLPAAHATNAEPSSLCGRSDRGGLPMGWPRTVCSKVLSAGCEGGGSASFAKNEVHQCWARAGSMEGARVLPPFARAGGGQRAGCRGPNRWHGCIVGGADK
jgi:hypothetical protein